MIKTKKIFVIGISLFIISLTIIKKSEGAILLKDKSGKSLSKAPDRREPSPASIEFLDSNGNVLKKINTEQKSYIKNGRSITEKSYCLKSKAGQHLLLVRTSVDEADKNPYSIRYSSSNHIEYYDDKGNVIFEKDTFYHPMAISENGEVIVALNAGFELLEKYHVTPKQAEDPKLLNGLITVISKNGKILYEKELPGPSPSKIEISPSGNWVAYTLANIHIVDVSTGKEISTDPKKENAEIKNASYRGIRDDGKLFFRKLLRQEKDGTRVFQTYSYSPFDKTVNVLGEVSEN